MKELKCRDGSIWRPPRMILMKQWQAEDPDNKWFENIYSHLYLRVSEFARNHFGYGDFPVDSPFIGARSSIWLAAGFSANFKQYASAVARQDRNVGGWDDLLVSKARREYLVTGIIGKALHKHVWESLLFGGTEAQKEMLEAQDKLTVELDGYQRTFTRSNNLRSLLVGSSITPNFWRDVDLLTHQLIHLLLPLLRLLDATFPQSKAKSLRRIYQDTNNIVTEAAFLSIGIRWSSDIFRFVWPIPGQPFDGDHEISISPMLYEESKKYAREADEAGQRSAADKARLVREEREALAAVSGTARVVSTAYKAGVEIKDGVVNTVVRLGMAGHDALSVQARRDEFREKPDFHVSRLGKVHIATWPCLVRHTIMGELGRHPVLGNLDAEGETITVIMSAPVVYYHGLDDAPGEFSERIPTLEEWVAGRRLERVWRAVGVVGGVVLKLVLGWAILSVAGRYIPVVGRFADAVGFFLRRGVEMAVRQVAVWATQVLFNLVRYAVWLFKVLVFVVYAVLNSVAEMLGRERPAGGPSCIGHDIASGGKQSWGRSAPPKFQYPQLSLDSVKVLWRFAVGWMSWKSNDSVSWERLVETVSTW